MRLLLICVFMSVSAMSQPAEKLAMIDSIKQVVNTDVHDSIKIHAYSTWDNIIYRYDPQLDLELTLKIDSICRVNLNKKLNRNEQQFFSKQHGNSSNVLGVIYDGFGDLKKAEEYYKVALEIRRSMNDKFNVANTLGNIGAIYKDLGDMNRALACYEESLTIREEIGDQRGIAGSYNNLGNWYDDIGENETSLKYHIMSYELDKKIGNKRGMSGSLNNMGLVYRTQGNHPKALESFEKSLKIQEELGYKRAIANTYNNLGILYATQGNLEKGREYYEKSLEIMRAIQDKIGQAHSLTNIGELLLRQGKYEESLSYFKEGKRLHVNAGDKKGMSNSEGNLAWLYEKMNLLDTALMHADSAEKHIKEVGDMNNLAALYVNTTGILFKLGRSDEALVKVQEALRIAEETNLLSVKTKASNSIYLLHRSRENLDSCRKYIGKLLSYNQEGLKMNFPILSEIEKEMYVKTMSKDVDRYYEFCVEEGDRYPDLAGFAYDNSILLKGILLKSSTYMRQAILSSGDSLLIAQYRNWQMLRKSISKSYSVGGDIEDLEHQANELEKELVRKSNEFSDFLSNQDISWKTIQKGLQQGEAAIEFISYKDEYVENSEDSGKVFYAAIILKLEAEYPEIIELFKEEELAEIVGSFPGNNLSYIQQVYGSKTNTKTQLYDLIWKPLEDKLKGSHKVYVSPVGLLHKISFSALAKKKDVYLCDNYDIETMSSTGKLAFQSEVRSQKTEVTLSSELPASNQTTTLFGGIDYNSDSTSTEHWKYLDGSLSETEQIEKILQKGNVNYKYFNQSMATEKQFKDIAHKSKILHIATHGFFYPDPDLAVDEFIDIEETEELISFRGGRAGVGVNSFVKSRNPMMRSGLAFAGANDVWHRTSVEGEDGVLTAHEVATIDLHNTDLVVLSACETGLGDIKGSEGVYGLQRSFKMAGVNYLIMSLWQVPDKETAEFMTTFYKHLTKTNDIKQSFKLTQKVMRKKYDPYYWAAFVLVE